MRNKIMVAMSGGVDSAAAALLLKSEYEVCGGTMLLAGDDAASAAESAEAIGIEHHIFDMRYEFKQTVEDAFAESYKKGETPNPCVVCNKCIKFGLFLDKALDLGCDKIATGHYIKLEYDASSSRYLLKKASDLSKDQSYMLYTLSQDVLSRCVFPLAELTKPEIRGIAQQAGIPSANKKDSQDICFIPDGDYRAFLKDRYGLNEKPGDFVLRDGTVLGRHKGLSSYTIGQRKGLGVSYTEPLYVLGKNSRDNTVILGQNGDLFSKKIYIRDTNWIPFDTLLGPMRLEGKIRYSQGVSKCTVVPVDDKNAIVEFDESQRAPTAGQSAVFYDGDVLVGGGVISLPFS